MRLLTPEQALALDHRTFNGSSEKSEQFAQVAADRIFTKIRELRWDQGRTLVLVGPGHNGWDGRLTADRLREQGTQVDLWELGKNEARNFFFGEYRTVIDGLFGVGLNRPLEKDAALIVNSLNQASHLRKNSKDPLRVLAIDVPSGLNALTGVAWGEIVQADATLTIQAPKPGFFQNQGPRFTGKIFVARLPYEESLFHELARTHFACGIATAAKLFPRRSLTANKGSFGTLHLVAGSQRYPGAGILAARSALRSGVGYLKFTHFDSLPQEWMTIPETLPELWEQIPNDFSMDAAWALGPGVTDRSRLLRVMRGLLKQGCDKVVLDASALDLIPELNRKLPSSWVITPHPKEMARLLGSTVEKIQMDRFAATSAAYQKFGATVLLKGYKTVVHSEGRNFIILRGNQALAKAGSGDVLTGMIGAYRAQGLTALDSAVLGALVQGIAADHWLTQGDAASLNPSDLVESLPVVQKQIKNWRSS